MLARIAAYDAVQPQIWIARAARGPARPAAPWMRAWRRGTLPLAGVPFAVKDNIDVAGLATTAACPAFAYAPEASATVVARLLAAGALCWARPTSTSSPPASSARAAPMAFRAMPAISPM
jgi:allophanate hydrolase